MSSIVVWIDSENAKIFTLKPEGVEAHAMKRHEPDHHTHSKREKHDSEHFYHQVAEKTAKATELLVVGPGMAKTQFKSHLERHDKALAKKVVGVESMDHPTEAQIVAAARKIFHTVHLFS